MCLLEVGAVVIEAALVEDGPWQLSPGFLSIRPSRFVRFIRIALARRARFASVSLGTAHRGASRDVLVSFATNIPVEALPTRRG